MQLSLYHFVRDFHEHFGIDIIKYVSRISGQSEWFKVKERTLCRVEGVPSSLHTHAALAPISAPT